jgi:5-methylcytosine-specific restriction endonuclease McrA
MVFSYHAGLASVMVGVFGRNEGLDCASDGNDILMARHKHEIQAFVKHQGRREWCPYCSVKLTPANSSIDHIHPQGAGGPHNWYNYAGTCKRCNNAKGHKTLLEFLLLGKKGVRQIEPIATVDLTALSVMPINWDDPLATLGYERPRSRPTWPFQKE